jgi:hypothetical protein
MVGKTMIQTARPDQGGLIVLSSRSTECTQHAVLSSDDFQMSENVGFLMMMLVIIVCPKGHALEVSATSVMH